MNIEPSIFREYDIRGTYPEQINEASIKLIAHAIARKCRDTGVDNIVVGRDGRLSGLSLLNSFCSGLLECGINVNNIGLVTSPLLYYAAKKSISKSGVMITGSHNPKNYNGIKMVINDSPISGTEIHSLISSEDSNNFKKGEIEFNDIKPVYIDEVCKNITIQKPENLKVVLDCGNGSAGCIAPDLFKKLGLNVIELFSEVDGNFPNHHPDPGKIENLEDLIQKVSEHRADIGFAFDGDGDRLGVVSNLGEIIFPDQLLMIFAQDVLSRNKGAQIIFDVKCSNLLAKTIEEAGGEPYMSATGHFHIKNALKKSGAPLAGEMSGHIFFNDEWHGFDDGHYSAFRLIKIIAQMNQNLSSIFGNLPKAFSTPEINIEVEESQKFKIVNEFIKNAKFQEGKKITIDGLRVDFKDGWGLLRASNTTPKLVLRFEAKTSERLDEIQKLFLDQLKQIDESIEIKLS